LPTIEALELMQEIAAGAAGSEARLLPAPWPLDFPNTSLSYACSIYEFSVD
jgi:hypothetical protein